MYIIHLTSSLIRLEEKVNTIDLSSDVRLLTVAETVRISNRKWIAIVALAIRNPFNMAPWNKVLGELAKRKVSKYPFNIINDYFRDTKITLNGG